MTDARRAGHGPADLILTGISKSFGRHRVLKDLDLRFPAGQITCVMAPSGAGKTTLLRILMGLETADAGEIREDNQGNQIRPSQIELFEDQSAFFSVCG